MSKRSLRKRAGVSTLALAFGVLRDRELYACLMALALGAASPEQIAERVGIELDAALENCRLLAALDLVGVA